MRVNRVSVVNVMNEPLSLTGNRVESHEATCESSEPECSRLILGDGHYVTDLEFFLIRHVACKALRSNVQPP